MKNEERADRLLSEAESIFNELEQALESENWNLTIRRAQEVVELVLKGLLAQLGSQQSGLLLFILKQSMMRMML
jgi:HEPN domain-containing protein